MIELFIFSFFIFLPAGVANMGPVFAARLPGLKNWKTPIDLGKTYRGKRIFGDHKTWRGLVFGTLLGTVVSIGLFQVLIQPDFGWSWVGASGLGGFLMSFGALVGDSLESFFKRQLGIDEGKSWFPYDQMDYILGGLAFSYPVFHWQLLLTASIFVLYFGLHLIAGYVGYLLGFKQRPI